MNGLKLHAGAGLVLAALLAAGGARAQPAWEAVSNTATAVTGDVRMAPGRITFSNGKALAIGMEPRKVDATIDGVDMAVQVYPVTRPEDPVLLGGNRLCGSGPVTFVAVGNTGAAGDGRVLAVYRGAAVPPRTEGLCATYYYAVN